MDGLNFIIWIPFLFALIIPLLFLYISRIHTGWFVLPVPVMLFAYFFRFLQTSPEHAPVSQPLTWLSFLNIELSWHLDGLSLLFTLIITGVGSLVVLYSIYYLDKETEALHNFYIYLLLFMGSMIGVVLSDNLMVLYVFWEMTSVSSLLLIAYWYERRKSRDGAQKSMLITIFGGFCMLMGFLLLHGMTGTFSIREMIAGHEHMMEHPLFVPAMMLILLGAFTKSAQFPFHIWLPDAMEAPTPISAYLHSATMVKAGLYLVARFTPIFGGSTEWLGWVTLIGILTLFWGSFMAVKQIDLKALLAYSTVSQLGLIMCLLGIGSYSLNSGLDQAIASSLSVAALAAMFHLINHSIFKGSLFMIVGIIDHETGTRDIRKLGGLMSLMPISFTLTVIGSLSMAGLPPFSGFLSKEMFFTGVLQASREIGSWYVLLPYAAWLASVFTFIYCFILIFQTFTGEYQPEKLDKQPDQDAPLGMLISPTILATFVVILFFFPNLLSDTILEPVMRAILPQFGSFEVSIHAWHGWNTELWMTIGIVLVGSLLYARLSKWNTIYDTLPARFTINHAYTQGLKGIEHVSHRLMERHMTGLSRDYLIYIFAFMIMLLGGASLFLFKAGFDTGSNAPISLFEWVLAIAMVAVAVVVALASSGLLSIIAVGALGYLMSLFFVIFRAPDLALTQLVVETITTTLFVLCLYYLPKMHKKPGPRRFRLTNLLIALGVGGTLTFIGLSAQGHRLFAPISNYFEDAYELAGAKNMVNAILVDFRALDTMMEIVVLLIAGLGVYTLIKLRPARRNDR